MNTQISVRAKGQVVYSALATTKVELKYFKIIALTWLYKCNGAGSITFKPI